MTLRFRLMAIIGLSLTVLWGATSVWMFLDVRTEFRDALDERLAASARMVAGLIAQLPDAPGPTASPTLNVLDTIAKDGVACEIRFLRGDVIARTYNSPSGLSMVQQGYHTRLINGQQWRSYTLEQSGKRVTTADRVDKRHALLRNIVFATVVPFLIAMLGSLAVLWFGIKQGLAPLESIRQALADRKPDATALLPLTPAPAEIEPLIETINRLLARTQSAIERERRFTGDAAHELRTPLTAIKTHIQVAQLVTGEETAESLRNAEQGVFRLQHTIEQLLTLARVEGPFSFGVDKTMNASAIAELARNEISAGLRQRIVLEGLGSTRNIAAPPVLVVTALRNILDNALRYSPSDSPVILRLQPSDKFCSFVVLDEGRGICKHDQDDAVRRFWRMGPEQGSGLGLSIVDAIVKRCEGEFEFAARPEKGMAVRIGLPVL